MNMNENQLRKKILSRELCIGTWIQIGHPTVAEILAKCGFEWIAADMEHAGIDIETYTNIVRAMSAFNTAPFARVTENAVMPIRQVLDAGASGVIVPLVNTAEEAVRAVAAAKYPPVGKRGFAFCRSNDWGEMFDEYATMANNLITVIVMIESRQAVENINEILSVDGVDGVFIGPYDLSGSYGIVGQLEHPTMLTALKQVTEACRAHKKAAGIHIVNPTTRSIENAVEDGYTFIALGMDDVFLMNYAKNALKEIRLLL